MVFVFGGVGWWEVVVGAGGGLWLGGVESKIRIQLIPKLNNKQNKSSQYS